jgi:hypothetical protein
VHSIALCPLEKRQEVVSACNARAMMKTGRSQIVDRPPARARSLFCLANYLGVLFVGRGFHNS